MSQKGNYFQMRSKQYTRQVTLMVRSKIDGKWIRTKAVRGKSGKVVPGLVLYHGQEYRLTDVSYDLRFYRAGKPAYRHAGKSASDAEEQRRTFAATLSARAVAESAGLTVQAEPDRTTVKQAGSDYVAKRSVDLGPDQIGRIKYVQRLFSESCKKVYLQDLKERDILDFLGHVSILPVFRDARANLSMRRNAVQRRLRFPTQPKVVSKRTVFNYFVVLYKWLVTMGVDKSIFPAIPKFEDCEVTIYSPEELTNLFALLTGSLLSALSLMLKCGLRRREVAYAYFSDIDFGQKTILVRGKPEWNFTVKNRLQRYVPVPDDLLELLAQTAAQNPGQRLIVPNPAGEPEMNLILKLKRFVYLHGLRCGRCEHCKIGNPECEEWELHKFRRTYATAIVRNVDLRTAQNYLGHKRITSTERYLRAASAADGQKAVSAIDFTKPFYN